MKIPVGIILEDKKVRNVYNLFYRVNTGKKMFSLNSKGYVAFLFLLFCTV